MINVRWDIFSPHFIYGPIKILFFFLQGKRQKVEIIKVATFRNTKGVFVWLVIQDSPQVKILGLLLTNIHLIGRPYLFSRVCHSFWEIWECHLCSSYDITIIIRWWKEGFGVRLNSCSDTMGSNRKNNGNRSGAHPLSILDQIIESCSTNLFFYWFSI